MKLLLVSPKMENSNGGIAVWTDMYLAACDDTVVEPMVLNTAPRGKRAENGSAKRNMLDELLRTRAIFKSLRSLLRKNRFDIVHLNTSCGRFGIIRDYLTAKKIRKIQPQAKIIVHYHCDIPVQVVKAVNKKYLARLLKISDENFVLCENSKEYLKKGFSISSKKVPNFVPEQLIADEKKAMNSTLKNAFFVGRVSIAKGAKEIYELAKRNEGIRFVLAGAVSDTVASWEKPRNLDLLGSVSHTEVLRMMDESDVFVFPSHTEGFSMALAEAMARGLPVIATDVGANADMLEGKGGVICPVGDIDAMNTAIGTLNEKSTRAEMSRWCIEKVNTCYRSDMVIALFIDQYKRLMETER